MQSTQSCAHHQVQLPPPCAMQRSVLKNTLAAAKDYMRKIWAACSPDKAETLSIFAATWWGNLVPDPRQLLEECAMLDAAASPRGRGRPRLVGDRLAFRAAAVFIRGWDDGAGNYAGFRDVPHAMRMSQPFAALAAEAGCSHATLLSAMQRACPAVGRVRERVKPSLSKTTMKLRKRIAGQLSRMPMQVFRATEWGDEASWGFSRLSSVVWGLQTKGERLRIDKRAPRSFSDMTVLHFFVSVNWAVGAHTLVWLTGTKGMGKGGFKVSNIPGLPCAP